MMKKRFPATATIRDHIKQYSPATVERLCDLIAILHCPWAPIREYRMTRITVDEVVQAVSDLYAESVETYDANLVSQFRKEVYGALDAYILQHQCMHLESNSIQ